MTVEKLQEKTEEHNEADFIRARDKMGPIVQAVTDGLIDSAQRMYPLGFQVAILCLMEANINRLMHNLKEEETLEQRKEYVMRAHELIIDAYITSWRENEAKDE